TPRGSAAPNPPVASPGAVPANRDRPLAPGRSVAGTGPAPVPAAPGRVRPALARRPPHRAGFSPAAARRLAVSGTCCSSPPATPGGKRLFQGRQAGFQLDALPQPGAQLQEGAGRPQLDRLGGGLEAQLAED